MGVVAISLWSDPLEKSFEKLCSAVFSQGTRLKTSGDPEISDEKKVRKELARKNLRDLEKQKCSKYTAPAKNFFLTVGKVQRKAIFSSHTSKKVLSVPLCRSSPFCRKFLQDFE